MNEQYHSPPLSLSLHTQIKTILGIEVIFLFVQLELFQKLLQ